MMFKQLHTHKPQLHPVVSLKVSVFDDHQQVRLIIEDEGESLQAGTHTHEETFPTSIL